jgi:hypothetical protein
MKTEITKESLEKFGMKLTGDPAVPMLKFLGVGSAGTLTLGVSRYRNADEFTLSFPEGMFYLNISCIEDLEKFESMLQSYEPNY